MNRSHNRSFEKKNTDIKHVVGNLSILANAVPNHDKYRFVAPVVEIFTYKQLIQFGFKIGTKCYYNTKNFVIKNGIHQLKNVQSKVSLFNLKFLIG
jgi:hypothetical protein